MTEEQAYEQAHNELDSVPPSKPLWLKATAHSNGEEKSIKAKYMLFRAEELLLQDRERIRVEGVAKNELFFRKLSYHWADIFSLVMLLSCFAFLIFVVCLILNTDVGGYDRAKMRLLSQGIVVAALGALLVGIGVVRKIRVLKAIWGKPLES